MRNHQTKQLCPFKKSPAVIVSVQPAKFIPQKPKRNNRPAPFMRPGIVKSPNKAKRNREPKMNRTHTVKVRLTEDEFSRMSVVMETSGYPTVSSFLRDVITRKRLPERRAGAVISDEILREKMNRLIYEVNKIGVNYNQVVTLYQKQSKQMRPDGTPYLNTRLLDEKMTILMRSTEGLRDEFAVMLDIVKRYINT